MLMLLVGLIGAWLAWRDRVVPTQRWYLRCVAALTPAGLIAVEAGWTVTEVGRQPWVIHGILRTEDAVTPMPGLVVPFTVATLMYLALSVIVVLMLRRHVFAAPTARGEVHHAS